MLALIFMLALVVFIAIVAAVFAVLRPRAVAGLGVRMTPPGAEPQVLGGRWNAMIFPESFTGRLGGTGGSTSGHLLLDGDVLSFVQDGTSDTAWSCRCAELQTALGLARPVRLDGPMGTVHCAVSIEHINIYTRNPFKDARELRYASEFVHVLRARGARTA